MTVNVCHIGSTKIVLLDIRPHRIPKRDNEIRVYHEDEEIAWREAGLRGHAWVLNDRGEMRVHRIGYVAGKPVCVGDRISGVRPVPRNYTEGWLATVRVNDAPMSVFSEDRPEPIEVLEYIAARIDILTGRMTQP